MFANRHKVFSLKMIPFQTWHSTCWTLIGKWGRVTRTENMSRKMKCQAFKLVKTLANNFANRLNKTSLLGIEPVLNWISTLLPHPTSLRTVSTNWYVANSWKDIFFSSLQISTLISERMKAQNVVGISAKKDVG